MTPKAAKWQNKEFILLSKLNFRNNILYPFYFPFCRRKSIHIIFVFVQIGNWQVLNYSVKIIRFYTIRTRTWRKKSRSIKMRPFIKFESYMWVIIKAYLLAYKKNISLYSYGFSYSLNSSSKEPMKYIAAIRNVLELIFRLN